jgi:hypothetical protein
LRFNLLEDLTTFLGSFIGGTGFLLIFFLFQFENMFLKKLNVGLPGLFIFSLGSLR